MIAKILFSQPIRCKSRSLLFISRSKIFPRLSLQLTCAGSRGFCFGGKRTEPVMHTLAKTKETTVQCRERGWSPTPQKVANLLVRFINQHMNERTVLRYSSYQLQPTRLQPSELHMWHSVAGQVAQENPQHWDCSYVQWARGYARKTIGKTHAWRLQLRWVVLTL